MVDVQRIGVELIRHRCDARPRADAALTALEGSIGEIGLLSPIIVRPASNGYEVVAGSHRLQAVELLGWGEIDGFVMQADDLKAELAIIDENLVRAELSPVDRAQQTARRKAIYEELHPETKAHVAGAHASNALQGNASANLAPAFSADTAAATGKSERSVQRDAERGEKIEPAALEAIRKHPSLHGPIPRRGEKSPRERSGLLRREAPG